MKLHNPLLLALLGWYLMMPPLGPRLDVNYKAPLETWFVSGTFDTAKECEDYRFRAKGRTENQLPPAGLPATTTTERTAETILFSRCIATDDPRLNQR